MNLEAHESLELPTQQQTKTFFEASQELLYGSYDMNDIITNDDQNNQKFLRSRESVVGSEGEPVVELVSENNMTPLLGNHYYPYGPPQFKYSIHSPNCRLYTIDEVNSTYSENDMSTNA